MVPMESGRTTLTKRIPGQTLEMDRICRMMKDKLEAAAPDGRVITPKELVQLVRYDGNFPQEM
jgi:hypothetical protein